MPAKLIRPIEVSTKNMQSYVKSAWKECITKLERDSDALQLRLRKNAAPNNEYVFDLATGAQGEEVPFAQELQLLHSRAQVSLPIAIPKDARISYRFYSNCLINETTQFELVLS